jgi:ectoine hydroxylase-related dioxygenase (phytanoyl-CoA dioxygenase family)
MPHFFSSTRVAGWHDLVCKFFAENRGRLWLSSDGADRRGYGIDRCVRDILDFSTDPQVQRIASSYIGEWQQVHFVLANHVAAAPGALGSGGGWHRDTPHERQFKALVYLSDVTERTGPFSIVRRSHRVRSIAEAVARGASKPSQHRFTDGEAAVLARLAGGDVLEVCAPAGSLVLFDSSAVHRGKPLLEGERWALTSYFYSPAQIRTLVAAGKFEDLILTARGNRVEAT